jgi:hypothetical protein
MASWKRLALVLAVACGGVSGCAQDGSYVLPDTTLRIPDAPVLSGVVSAEGPADIAVDIGAARPVSVTLAEVTAADCDGAGAAVLATALAGALPVGTAVVLVRSGAQPRHGDPLSAFVHVRPARTSVAAAAAGVSVNEALLASGHARLTPALDHGAAAAPIDRQAAGAAANAGR